MGCRAMMGLCAWVLAAPIPASAMTFTSKPSDGVTVVWASGEIVPGDAERLTAELLLAPRGVPVVMRVDSHGGSVVAGETLAAVVHRYRVAVAVGAGDTCASACFLLFAASPLRMAAETGQVGVHSASSAAGETMASMATTTVMARSAADLGVPAAIVGRMVATAPGAMAWLTRAELATLGAHMLDEAPAPPPPAGAAPAPAVSLGPPAVASLPHTHTPTPRPPPTRVTGTVPPDERSAPFQQGRAERAAWERWFAGLSGDMRDGAEFWLRERERRPSSACTGTAAFVAGCEAARARLAGPDARRHTEPQFWWGWGRS